MTIMREVETSDVEVMLKLLLENDSETFESFHGLLGLRWQNMSLPTSRNLGQPNRNLKKGLIFGHC